MNKIKTIKGVGRMKKGISLLDAFVLDRKDYENYILMDRFLLYSEQRLAFQKWKNSLSEERLLEELRE